MKVDPIMLDRGAYTAEVSKNDPTHSLGKNKWGLMPWKKRQRSNIGVNPSNNLYASDLATAATAANVPKGILKAPNQTPNHSYDSLVTIDRLAIVTSRSLVTNESIKKVTWDVNVKDTQKLSFVAKKKAAIISVVRDLQALAVELDDSVQKVRERMQCGSMDAAKNFYCPSEGEDIVTRTCGKFADQIDEAFDEASFGTNDIAYDDRESNTVDESREEEGCMHRRGDDQLEESREESEIDRYVVSPLPFEDRADIASPTATTQRKTNFAVEKKKKKKNTLVVRTNAASVYYTSPANKATKIDQDAMDKKVVEAKKKSVKKKPTPTLQHDESVISALTENTNMNTLPIKKTPKGRRRPEYRRYTTVQPKQSKTGLKGTAMKPIKLMSIGLKSHLKTRKMLTFKATKNRTERQRHT